MLEVVDMGQGAGLQLSLSLWKEIVAAETMKMEGVVWKAVNGFELPCAIILV